MKRSVLTLVLSVVALLLMAAPLWQQPVPIRTGYDIVWNQCATATQDNGMVYVWSDNHTGDRKLYAQKVNSLGIPAWTAPIQLDTSAGYQAYGVLTPSSDNGYIVVYRNYQSPSGDILKAQKISDAGQLLWTATGKTISSYVQSYSKYDLVSDNAGGAFVAWMDYRNPNSNIYGQHILSSGQVQWGGSGLNLVGENIDSTTLNLAPDGSGGLLLGYQYSNYNPYYGAVVVKRILPIGLTSWSHSILIGEYSSDSVISHVVQNSFLVSWSGFDPDSNLGYIKAQRFSLDGNFLWDAPATVMGDSLIFPLSSYNGYRKIKMALSSDNAVLIAWEDSRTNPDFSNIYAQKLDLDGNRLWTATGVPVDETESYKSGLQLIANTSGGCFLSWSRQGADYGYSAYAQQVDLSGMAVWQANGVNYSASSPSQTLPVLNYLNGNLVASWDDARDGSTAIWYQFLDSGGNSVLPYQGRQLIWGLGGGVYEQNVRLYPRVNDVAVVWQDFRNTNPRIFYQFVHPDGTMGLAANGRAVTDSVTAVQETPSVAVSADGQMLIAWMENNRIKLQLIDVNGDHLWGSSGINLTDTVPLRQKSPQVSFEDEAFYLGWDELEAIQTELGERDLYRVYGQKFVNNARQWGDNGILVSSNAADDLLYDGQIGQLAGRYFVWSRYSVEPATFGYQNVYAKLLNPDGTTAGGWPEAGIPASDYTGWDVMQYMPQATITPAGLFVCWLDYRMDFMNNLFGQLISPAGVRLWDPLGVELNPSEFETDTYQLLPGNDLILAWTEGSYTQENCYIQKFSAAGLPSWTDEPVLFSGAYANIYNTNPALARFDNGGIVAAWTMDNDNNATNNTDADIYYRYISPAGVSLGATYGYMLTNRVFEQTNPDVCVLNNEAYISWVNTDFFHTNSGGEIDYKDFHSIYMQKVNNEVVGVDDEVAPLAGVSLRQNTPNPFSTQTSIAFTLPAKTQVELSIYNLKGQKVRTLLDAKRDKGPAAVTWDGRDADGKSCASGVYYYRLAASGRTLTRKLVLLR